MNDLLIDDLDFFEVELSDSSQVKGGLLEGLSLQLATMFAPMKAMLLDIEPKPGDKLDKPVITLQDSVSGYSSSNNKTTVYTSSNV